MSRFFLTSRREFYNPCKFTESSLSHWVPESKFADDVLPRKKGEDWDAEIEYLEKCAAERKVREEESKQPQGIEDWDGELSQVDKKIPKLIPVCEKSG